MEIYYQSSDASEKIYLDRAPYWLTSDTDVFDHEWDTDTKNGATIVTAKRKAEKRTVNIAVQGQSGEDCLKLYDEMTRKLDADNEAAEAGRLYAGDSYLQCWLMAGKASGGYIGSKIMKVAMTVLPLTGNWIQEKKKIFWKSADSASAGFLDYDYDYPYDYYSGDGLSYLDNDASAAADFEMTIYGSCENPNITVGDHCYSVSATLEKNEVLVINSESKKIYKITASGETINQYYLQNRDWYIFQKIPTGHNAVLWSGLFGFDITVFEKRSVPQWT